MKSARETKKMKQIGTDKNGNNIYYKREEKDDWYEHSLCVKDTKEQKWVFIEIPEQSKKEIQLGALRKAIQGQGGTLTPEVSTIIDKKIEKSEKPTKARNSQPPLMRQESLTNG